MENSNKRRRINKNICGQCPSQSDCCQRGAFVDLDEAKKIVALGLKGEFFQLEMDRDFPSGFRIGTSYDDNPCSFLDPDGLCSIHKVDYELKPKSCKDFPYENNRRAPLADVLCTMLKFEDKKSDSKRTECVGGAV
jgi:hypothetical protein